jgi:large subunit ribosomal protein L25
VAELAHDSKLKYLTDEDATIAHVVAIREEVAPAVDAVAAAAPAEPEVVKKGKQDAEEGDAAGAKGAKK